MLVQLQTQQAQLQSQMQTQQSQMQLELANIKAALTGTPLREEQPVTIQPLTGKEQSAPADTDLETNLETNLETDLDSSPVEELILSAGTTQTADFNIKPATSVVDSHTESATSSLIGPGVSDEGHRTMEGKFRKWVNRISVLSYVNVKDKSAADLRKRLDKLRYEFVRHTEKLVIKIWQIF